MCNTGPNNTLGGAILQGRVYLFTFFQIRAKVDNLYHELESLDLDWDLIFLGRKILWNTEEPWVKGSQVLVHVNYTYWTLAYMLSQRGAQKLLDEKPLPKMVPGMFTNDTQNLLYGIN